MHRSYNSYNPVASKLLQKRWDEKHFHDHRKAVTGVKPEIDSTPPVTFMHLHLKLKKLQLEEERLATIERDNRILLEKMSHTMRNKGQLDNINTAVPKSLSKGRRERELLRITRENMNMLKRIAYKKPAISRDQHEKDWKENHHFMSNISAFPDDWYLKNRCVTTSQPNLRSERSDSTQNTTKRHESASTQDRPSPRTAPVQDRRKSTPKKIVEVVKKAKTPSPVPSSKPSTPVQKAATPVNDIASEVDEKEDDKYDSKDDDFISDAEEETPTSKKNDSDDE